MNVKITLILLFSVLFGTQLFAQSYSYSFEGNLTPDQLTELESKCRAIPHLSACKIKYKPEANKGEIIVRTDTSEERREKSELFSPLDVKSLLMQNGLIPLDFTLLND